MTKTPKPPARKWTEAELTALLRRRLTRSDGPGEYAFATDVPIVDEPGTTEAEHLAFLAQVRNAAGFNATRTFDAVSMGLWPSRGLLLHAYEIKCSRNDWLRELKDPAKAEAAAALVDTFTIVVGDEHTVKPEELPPRWGFMAVRGEKLVELRKAAILPEADTTRPIKRSFVVAMLRAGGAVPTATAEDVRKADAAGYERGVKAAKSSGQDWERMWRELNESVHEFEEAASLSIRGGYVLGGRQTPAEVGAAVKAVLASERHAAQARERLANVHRQLTDAAKLLEPYLPGEADDGVHRERSA